MKVFFSSISYGPTDPQADRSRRVAMMTASNHGVKWAGDISPDRMKWDVARNEVVKQTLDFEGVEDEDRIFWCDNDVILPPDAILRLAENPNDFTCGVYFMRAKPHWPLIATFRHIDKKTGGGFNWIIKWPENQIAPIDGCGFGCVMTSVRMLKKMPFPWFKFEVFSEDLDFCINARKSGFQLYCDTGVICGHLPEPVPVDFEIFKACHPEFYPVNGQEVANAKGQQSVLGSEPTNGEVDLHSQWDQPDGTSIMEACKF